jgi:phosphate starvation-inducible PhoH-like protein
MQEHKRSLICLATLANDEGIDTSSIIHDHVLSAVENTYGIQARLSDDQSNITLTGVDKQVLRQAKRNLISVAKLSNENSSLDIAACVVAVKSFHNDPDDRSGFSAMFFKNKTIRAQTPNQSNYVDVMLSNIMSFGIGPAGCGKTYLAVARALELYYDAENGIRKIFITRPPVTAGKQIGHLPGGESDKLGPFVRPILDVFEELLGREILDKWLEDGTIEVNHIGYFRGRTFKNAVVIVDETQNCTEEEGRMIVTRLGSGSFMMINGDVEQKDLKEPDALSFFLENFTINDGPPEDVNVAFMTEDDCIRHPIVAALLKQFKVTKEKRHQEYLARKKAREEAKEKN